MIDINGKKFDLYPDMGEMLTEDADHVIGVLRDIMDIHGDTATSEAKGGGDLADILLPIISGEMARKICASCIYSPEDPFMPWSDKYDLVRNMKYKDQQVVLATFFGTFFDQVMESVGALAGILLKKQNGSSKEA